MGGQQGFAVVEYGGGEVLDDGDYDNVFIHTERSAVTIAMKACIERMTAMCRKGWVDNDVIDSYCVVVMDAYSVENDSLNCVGELEQLSLIIHNGKFYFEDHIVELLSTRKDLMG